jgi:hypothetical protein
MKILKTAILIIIGVTFSIVDLIHRNKVSFRVLRWVDDNMNIVWEE